MTGLTFDPATHTYALDGVRVPSVTGILRASGRINFSGIPPGVLEAARVRGTTVHTAIHYYNERDLNLDAFVDQCPQYAGYVLAWVEFCRMRKFVAVLNEHRIVSRRHRVAGTLDCLGLLDGLPVLIDFKTGRAEDAAAHLQTAGYLMLAREWATEDAALFAFIHAHRVITRHAVQLKADGRFVVETYRDPLDYRQFVALTAEHREAA